MAKRRKTKTRSRRRRVGAMSLAPSSALVKYGSIAAGFFLGDKINDQVDKMTGGKIDGKIIGAGEAGIGALLVFGKGAKSLPKSLIGGILLGAGAKKVLKEFGVLNGIGGFRGVPVIGGYRGVPVIGAGPSLLNGYNVPSKVGAYNVPSKMSVMNGFNGGDANGSGINPSDR